MVKLKTSKERIECKKEQQKKKDKMILSRFEQLRNEYSISDAVRLTANEFNLSEPTIYNIRRRNII